MNPWYPVDGAVWADNGLSLAGGSMSLGVGPESCSLVPLPGQHLCFLCVDEDWNFNFLVWLPADILPSSSWSLLAGTVSQRNSSISRLGHGILSWQQKLITPLYSSSIISIYLQHTAKSLPSNFMSFFYGVGEQLLSPVSAVHICMSVRPFTSTQETSQWLYSYQAVSSNQIQEVGKEMGKAAGRLKEL